MWIATLSTCDYYFRSFSVLNFFSCGGCFCCLATLVTDCVWDESTLFFPSLLSTYLCKYCFCREQCCCSDAELDGSDDFLWRYTVSSIEEALVPRSLGGVVVPLRLLQWAMPKGYLCFTVMTSVYTLKVNIYWKKNAQWSVLAWEEGMEQISFCLFSSLIHCFTLDSLFQPDQRVWWWVSRLGLPPDLLLLTLKNVWWSAAGWRNRGALWRTGSSVGLCCVETNSSIIRMKRKLNLR